MLSQLSLIRAANALIQDDTGAALSLVLCLTYRGAVVANGSDSLAGTVSGLPDDGYPLMLYTVAKRAGGVALATAAATVSDSNVTVYADGWQIAAIGTVTYGGATATNPVIASGALFDPLSIIDAPLAIRTDIATTERALIYLGAVDNDGCGC